MSQQLEILPQLVEVCSSIDEHCGVVLIGSVARGMECPTSDIDLNIIFPGDEPPARAHPYISDDNRWQLVVKDIVDGFRIDVAWETQSALLQRLQSDDVLNCWPFSNGRILSDPDRVAEPCLEVARAWYQNHPEIAAKYEAVYTEAKRRQRESRGLRWDG